MNSESMNIRIKEAGCKYNIYNLDQMTSQNLKLIKTKMKTNLQKTMERQKWVPISEIQITCNHHQIFASCRCVSTKWKKYVPSIIVNLSKIGDIIQIPHTSEMTFR